MIAESIAGYMRDHGIKQKYVCQKTGLSKYIIGHREWQLEDIYSIMDLIHRPYEEIPIYFPRKGVPVTRIQTRPPRRFKLVEVR